MEEDVQAIVEWYRKMPEEQKRHVIFRFERMGDESIADLYHTLVVAKRLSKMWKSKGPEVKSLD